jgi:hypothetical protein
MKRILLFAFLFCSMVSYGQRTTTKSVYDTIPSSLLIYRTDSAISIPRVVRGYEVYEDSLVTTPIRGYTYPAIKDTVYGFSEYMADAWFVEYLDVNKKPLEIGVGVWLSKPDRSCNMHPLRGL